ncbi:hypothetical protein ES703_13586 [subsurface metagenome]
MGLGKKGGRKDIEKALGQGRRVDASNPLEVHDPKVGSLISYEGVTTADGAADGSSLEDSVLTTKPNYNGNLVIITSGAYAGQGSDIDGVTTGGTVTAHTAFDGQILRGTNFVIVALRLTPAEVAALTTMVQTGQYYDRVFYDSVTGIAGTAWPVGTPQVPSDVIADIITILAARNLKTIDVHGTLTLGAAMNHLDFFGRYHESAGDIVNLGGQDVSDSHFRGLIITGVQGGAGLATYKECLFFSTLPIPMTGFRGLAENCGIFGGLTLATGNADYADFDHCTSVHGVATVIIGSPDRVSFKEFSGGLILSTQTGGDAFVRGISGYLEVDEMTGGTLDIYARGAEIQINADCTGGTINIYGNARVTDASAGGCTVNDYTKETQLDTIEAAIAAIAGVDAYVEQIPDTDVNETVEDVEANCVLVNLAYVAGRTYALRHLRLKCADPGAQTVTIRLYERWNDAIAQLIDSFDIDGTNFGTYHSLMDMFAVPEIHSDAILIRAVHDGASPADDVEIEVTYRYAVAI